MMEIIDNVENPMEIRQAALIQLKNTIKQRWYATQGEMERAEK